MLSVFSSQIVHGHPERERVRSVLGIESLLTATDTVMVQNHVRLSTAVFDAIGAATVDHWAILTWSQEGLSECLRLLTAPDTEVQATDRHVAALLLLVAVLEHAARSQLTGLWWTRGAIHASWSSTLRCLPSPVDEEPLLKQVLVVSAKPPIPSNVQLRTVTLPDSLVTLGSSVAPLLRTGEETWPLGRATAIAQAVSLLGAESRKRGGVVWVSEHLCAKLSEAVNYGTQVKQIHRTGDLPTLILTLSQLPRGSLLRESTLWLMSRLPPQHRPHLEQFVTAGIGPFHKAFEVLRRLQLFAVDVELRMAPVATAASVVAEVQSAFSTSVIGGSTQESESGYDSYLTEELSTRSALQSVVAVMVLGLGRLWQVDQWAANVAPWCRNVLATCPTLPDVCHRLPVGDRLDSVTELASFVRHVVERVTRSYREPLAGGDTRQSSINASILVWDAAMSDLLTVAAALEMKSADRGDGPVVAQCLEQAAQYNAANALLHLRVIQWVDGAVLGPTHRYLPSRHVATTLHAIDSLLYLLDDEHVPLHVWLWLQLRKEVSLLKKHSNTGNRDDASDVATATTLTTRDLNGDEVLIDRLEGVVHCDARSPPTDVVVRSRALSETEPLWLVAFSLLQSDGRFRAINGQLLQPIDALVTALLGQPAAGGGIRSDVLQAVGWTSLLLLHLMSESSMQMLFRSELIDEVACVRKIKELAERNAKAKRSSGVVRHIVLPVAQVCLGLSDPQLLISTVEALHQQHYAHLRLDQQLVWPMRHLSALMGGSTWTRDEVKELPRRERLLWECLLATVERLRGRSENATEMLQHAKSLSAGTMFDLPERMLANPVLLRDAEAWIGEVQWRAWCLQWAKEQLLSVLMLLW